MFCGLPSVILPLLPLPLSLIRISTPCAGFVPTSFRLPDTGLMLTDDGSKSITTLVSSVQPALPPMFSANGTGVVVAPTLVNALGLMRSPSDTSSTLPTPGACPLILQVTSEMLPLKLIWPSNACAADGASAAPMVPIAAQHRRRFVFIYAFLYKLVAFSIPRDRQVRRCVSPREASTAFDRTTLRAGPFVIGINRELKQRQFI